MNNKLPNAQLIAILVSVAYFSTLGVGFSAAYGGLIGLMNTWLVNRHINKQRESLTISAQAGVGMMVISVLMRMALVVALTLIGLFFLKLKPDALIASLIFGLIGFLIDRAWQK